ncbi:hypothetical protein [Parathalassolituus penaei]|uniref:Uncharacterized protein n=1 Tax=Parathalassolituus penaei TaxID=2997323 RepID=A0A9X3EMV4_9GAMM|nr:hypothetical protein [Parathalassolituus penaei]MCY0967171.1 hypothetical protein [Parathalassolituus penaei]
MRRINALMILLAAALPTQALTSSELGAWMTGMPEIKNWLDTHQDQLPEQPAAPGSSMETVFQQGVEQLRGAGLYGDFESLVRAKGFESVERWSVVSTEVTRAFVAIEMEKEAASVTEMQNQLQQVKSMPGMPEEQRQAMINMLEQSLGMIKEAQSAPSADKELVRSHLEEVRGILDSDNPEE